MRASDLGVPIDNYKDEIFKSIEFLKSLKNKGKSVALKLYDDRLVWKMIIIDNFIWLQYYQPKKHVQDVPVYGVHQKQDKETLFGPLYAVFQKKWNFDYNSTYDFGKDELVYPPDKEGNIRREKLSK